MSEMSRNARRAMRAKIHRITQATSGKVDASDYGPEEVLDAGVKTGMRPVSRRAFKKGGKVVAVEGKNAPQNAGKKARSGGKPLSIDALVNRNVKDANEAREGKKHVGGLKRGGRATGGNAGDMVPTGLLPSQGASSRMSKAAGLKKGGRAHKAGGGPDVGGTISGQQKANQDAMLDAIRQRMARKQPDPGIPSSGPSAAPAPTRPDRDTLGRGPRKSGGKVHSDVAEDRALIGKMVKKGALTGKKSGGRAAKSTGGDIALGLASPMALGLSKLIGKKDEDDGNQMKSGGRTAKKRGGGLSMDGEYQGTRPTGGRLAKRDGGSLAGMEMNTGGRAKGKGKTNINIVIGTGTGQKPVGMAPGMPQPPMTGVPVQVPPIGAAGAGAPPPMPAGGPPPMPMPAGAPAGLGGAGPAPMGRKRGGRTYRSYKDMDAGAGSGLGRLEKTEIQKHKK